MSLFGKKTKVVDSSAEKAESTKTKMAKKAPAKQTKAVALPKAEKAAEAKAKKSTAEKRAEAVQGVSFGANSAVIKPRITEKATALAEKGIYVFDVKVDANTRSISAAILEAYKVTPAKINVSPVKGKAMFVRGRKGRTVEGKKAYVFLKKGDTITFN